MFERILSIIQIALAVIVVALILLQQKGTTLGGAFGGEGNVYSTKRGAEKVIFIATIVVGVLFVGVALANVLIRR